MIRKLVDIKDPKLRKKSKPIRKVDKKIKKLIADMKETLLTQDDPEGVGLAGPQIGQNLRIFLINFKDKSRVVINPKILSIKETKKNRKRKTPKFMEGCLSLPHYYGPVKKPDIVKLEYLNENGKKVTETFRGFMAQIVQHEVDHLEGILFVDRLLEQKKPLYEYKNGEWQEVDLA